jgi:aryl-alcohol dehydrogenase-like predicted oxidoreductase
VSSALIGFGEVQQIDEAIEALDQNVSALEPAKLTRCLSRS